MNTKKAQMSHIKMPRLLFYVLILIPCSSVLYSYPLFLILYSTPNTFSYLCKP